MADKTPQQKLRLATRADHDAIEQVHPIRAVLAGHGGRDGYGRLLRDLARWYQPLEAHMRQQAILAALPMAGDRWCKTDWLISDLAALGMAIPVPSAPPAAVPMATDAAGWLGIAYTLEGATLGGAMLTPQIAACLGADVPSRFYHGYGADTGRYWRDLVADLNQHLGEPAALAGAIQGARNCFTALRSWLMQEAVREA